MVTRLNLLLGFLVAAALIGLSQDVQAQYSGTSAFNLRGATRNFLFNRPTVSPYLYLTSRDSSYGLPNYQAYVRPLLEQQQQEGQRQQQMARMQQQLSNLQDAYRKSQAESAQFFRTGHPTRFGLYATYYPGFLALSNR